MKKLLFLAGITLPLIALAVDPPPFGSLNWMLLWNHPGTPDLPLSYAPGTNSMWHVYGTPNVGQPVTQWQSLTNFTSWGSTNMNGTNFFFGVVSVPVIAQWFFTVVPTNSQGEYPLALVAVTAQTDPALLPPSQLGLSKK